MRGGDISNKKGPAIAIDADLLFTVKKKWFGLRYELKFMLSSRHLLERWFVDGDLAIYIVCTGEMAEYKEKIEEILDTFMAPYTSVIWVEGAYELNYLIVAEHIIGYFYHGDPPVTARTDTRKFYKVPNVAEISYLLDGGVRR